MYAQLEYNLCHGTEVTLAIYRSEKAAKSDDVFELMRVSLTNAQLSELILMAKIKPVNMDK